jgi:hypothetical protein
LLFTGFYYTVKIKDNKMGDVSDTLSFPQKARSESFPSMSQPQKNLNTKQKLGPQMRFHQVGTVSINSLIYFREVTIGF